MSSRGLNRVQFLALACFAERPWHGYALRREIARRSDDSVRPGPASVHRTIRQLLDEGLVRESEERPSPAVDDSRRRYFVATPEGRRVLAAEAERWGQIAARARRALAERDR